MPRLPSLSARRAWIEILSGNKARLVMVKSLSARRAWIEIHFALRLETWLYVALRKESVDRNLLVLVFGMPTSVSLSARRAWIEIIVAASITT